MFSPSAPEGLLDLPIIGRVSAVGLRTKELAKLITYRLQDRSGFAIRPLLVRALTTVKHRQSAASSNSGKIEEPPPSAVKPSADGFRSPVVPAATAQQQALERERSKAGALQQNLSAAHLEVEAARGEAIAARQGMAAQRQQAAKLTKELSAARAAIATLKAAMARQTNAASRAGKPRKPGSTSWSRANAVKPPHWRRVSSRRVVKSTYSRRARQTAGDQREETIRRELAASREELDAMRRTARDGNAQARQPPTGWLSKTEPWKSSAAEPKGLHMI